MALTVPIGPQTFVDGDTSIPETPIPAGTTSAALTLDVSHMVPGQVLYFHVEYFDGGSWAGSRADFTGPSWTDKQGVVHTDSSLTIGFGSVPDSNGNWTPRASQPGWKARGTLTAVNGPITTNGGSLVTT